MNAIQPKDTTQKLLGEVRLARLQLAKAESELVEAKEHARLARRRRKEAKQSARRAKKQARQAKENVTGAKLALADLEAKLARPNSNRARRKSGKSPAKTVAGDPRRKSLVGMLKAQPREPLKVRRPAARRTASRRKLRPSNKVAKRRIARIGDLAAPVVLIPPEGGKATGQMIEEVKRIFTGEIPPEPSAKAAVLENLSPLEANPAAAAHAATGSTINPQESP